MYSQDSFQLQKKSTSRVFPEFPPYRLMLSPNIPACSIKYSKRHPTSRVVHVARFSQIRTRLNEMFSKTLVLMLVCQRITSMCRATSMLLQPTKSYHFKASAYVILILVFPHQIAELNLFLWDRDLTGLDGITQILWVLSVNGTSDGERGS